MEVHATLRLARIAPRKARLVANVVRGLPWPVAEVRLRVLDPRAAPMLLKLLRSAAANAEHNFHLDPKQMRVTQILVNEGPRLKRWMPRARGSSARIVKRTSHIHVVLADDTVGEKSAKPATPATATLETRKVEELTAEELKAAVGDSAEEQVSKTAGTSGKRGTAPRGARRLLERKHGSV